MDVTYTDRARQRNHEFALLQEVSKRLEEVIGPPSARVKAQWDRIEDEKGRPLYTLRISDSTGSAQRQFTPLELRFSTSIPIRLHQVWGDLLQVRSDAQHRKVEELIAQLPEG